MARNFQEAVQALRLCLEPGEGHNVAQYISDGVVRAVPAPHRDTFRPSDDVANDIKVAEPAGSETAPSPTNAVAAGAVWQARRVCVEEGVLREVELEAHSIDHLLRLEARRASEGNVSRHAVAPAPLIDMIYAAA